MPPAAYFHAMLVGFGLTVLVETVVLWFALSRRHPPRTRLFAGVWLTACTYPVVWLVLPPLFEARWPYLLVAETFAPVAECVLFWLAFVRRNPQRSGTGRDVAAVVAANLCSFGLGEVLIAAGWFG